MSAYRIRSRQAGVAVVTALLLTTLAITIVASLFWQQQVQVRSIENQRMQLQKKWIIRGAIDWARLILREDARTSFHLDYLDEPWAVKLQDTRLDQYVENGHSDTDESDATLSGQIVDAQSMYNINNLATNGLVNNREVAVFSRLLANLQISASLANKAALMIAQSQSKVSLPVNGPDSSASGAAVTKTNSNTDQSEVQFFRFTQLEDLLSVPGFTPDMILKLRSYATVLPRTTNLTAINVNTAPAEVIAARIDGVSLSDAELIVASRTRAYFKDVADFKNRFEAQTKTLTDGDIQVWTNYFFVNGKVKMNRSALDVSALVERADNAATAVLWVREN